MIKYFVLAAIMNVNFALLGRVMQGASTVTINTEKIRGLEEKPCIYCNFTTLRFVFVCLIFYNALLIADSFAPLPILLYLVYWLPVVWWWHVFYNLDFKYAIAYSSFSSKFATVLAVTFEPHPAYWVPSCMFSVYCLYLSLWYRYCLPT